MLCPTAGIVPPYPLPCFIVSENSSAIIPLSIRQLEGVAEQFFKIHKKMVQILGSLTEMLYICDVN